MEYYYQGLWRIISISFQYGFVANCRASIKWLL